MRALRARHHRRARAIATSRARARNPAHFVRAPCPPERSPEARKAAWRTRHTALAHRGTLQFPGAHQHANPRARCADPRVLGTRENDRLGVGEVSGARGALGRRRRARGRGDHAMRMHESAIRRRTVEFGRGDDGGFRAPSLGVLSRPIVVARIRGCGRCGDPSARSFCWSRAQSDLVGHRHAHATRTVHQRRAGRSRTRQTTERDHGHQQEQGPKGAHGIIQTHPGRTRQGNSSLGGRVQWAMVRTARHCTSGLTPGDPRSVPNGTSLPQARAQIHEGARSTPTRHAPFGRGPCDSPPKYSVVANL